MPKLYGKANFHRKIADIHSLEFSEEGRTNFVIEKTIILNDSEWEEFKENFFAEPHWIHNNIKQMFVDTNDIWHCLYITRPESGFGVLIESEGYDYARYTALIADADIKSI